MGRARTLIATIAAASAVSMMTASPVAAQGPSVLRLAPGDGCPDDYVCLFGGPSFSEGGYAVHSRSAVNDFQALYFNDEMTSWINATRYYYCWYQHAEYIGVGFVMSPHSALSEEPASRNNTAASLQECPFDT
ncbi:peptidase inhibitor family I36 protein [Streptomyces sp. NPDC057910]|uniref:peptidase inhibitor family I36 protein n=1 Tax=Streptomyces sp. NPDC057910 TaxID=3346278 RepID=UPI0036EE02BC